LADSKDDDILGAELESRLDDLFGEDDAAEAQSNDRDPAQSYPLAELKNLVLSIDWEITDEVLENFLQQLKDLKLTYEHDKIVVTFLQILNSLGDYIKTNRGNAHPKTFKILNAVFASLDKVVLSRDMAEKDKKKMLRAAMNSYQKLRMQIAARKTSGRRKTKADASATDRKKSPAKIEVEDTAETPVEATAETLEPEPAAVQPEDTYSAAVEEESTAEESTAMEEGGPATETLAEAVTEIKAYIHSEIEALKKRIEQLDRGQ
jgi:hypothetical protein